MQDDDKNILFNNLAKLEWACRRGMLELDVLLGNFLREAYPSLSSQDKALFVKILSSSDPELFAWIMGHEIPQDENTLRITEMIRNHARSRFQT